VLGLLGEMASLGEFIATGTARQDEAGAVAVYSSAWWAAPITESRNTGDEGLIGAASSFRRRARMLFCFTFQMTSGIPYAARKTSLRTVLLIVLILLLLGALQTWPLQHWLGILPKRWASLGRGDYRHLGSGKEDLDPPSHLTV